MYKVVALSRMLAVKIDNMEELSDHVREHVESGEAVMIVDELDDVESFGLDPKDIEIVG
jgi:hypothetical protein